MGNLLINNQKVNTSININTNGKNVILNNNTSLFDLITPCNINLFNKETIFLKQVPNLEGVIGYNALAYACSDYIKVEAGKQYCCSCFGYVWEYDENKNFIRRSWYNNPATVPNGVVYIILQIPGGLGFPTLDEFMLVEGNKLTKDCYPHKCYIINKDKVKDINGSSNPSPIDGLTIDFVGDSMTVQGSFVSYMEIYHNIIAKKYSANGSTLTYLARNRLLQADKNADAIVFMAGTNDAHYILNGTSTEEIGTFEDAADAQTFAGAVHFMCQYLLENFKMKRILICSSPRRHDKISGTPVDELLDKYVTLEKQIVESYGLPFLDLFHEYAHYCITSDGIHPTIESGKLIGRVMTKRLENM